MLPLSSQQQLGLHSQKPTITISTTRHTTNNKHIHNNARRKSTTTTAISAGSGFGSTSSNGSNNNNNNKSSQSSTSKEAKLAVATKIAAARALAKKLSEEKQAAAAAAKLASENSVDADQAKKMVESAEQEVSNLAREAAMADVAARGAMSKSKAASQQDGTSKEELQKLKVANEELQKLVMQLAADRKEAESKLKDIHNKFDVDLGNAAIVETAVEKEAVAASTLPVRTAAAASSTFSSSVNIKTLAEESLKSGSRIFTVPTGPIQVGSTVTVYYDRSRGPLPSSNSLTTKIGWNNWERIELLAMTSESSSSLAGTGGDWWSTKVTVPQPLFKLDFVVMDDKSGAVDNNGAKDFRFEVKGAVTREELMAQRLEAVEAFEAKARAELAAEEDRIYSEWMTKAKKGAAEAQAGYKNQRKSELLAEARSLVSERRGSVALAALSKSASIDGTFTWLPSSSSKGPAAGSTATLAYNRTSGPLSNCDSITLHVGYDGWWMKEKRSLPMSKMRSADVTKHKLSPSDGDWWSVAVPVWNTAGVLDFVLSDASLSTWDNNAGQDFHTEVSGAASGDKLVDLIYTALEAAGDDASMGGERAARGVMERASSKAKSARRRREVQQRFLYTKPLVPVAGKEVEIYYNPDQTALRGRPDVYVHGGFNRWSHPQKVENIQMVPVVPGGPGFMSAKVTLPADAHWLDLTFSDSANAQSGFMDDHKGLGYHLPVQGAQGEVPRLRVVHVASEMAPIAKAGGLGDVVTALARAVADEGNEVEVILPKYDCLNYNLVQGMHLVKDFFCENVQIKIWRGKVEGVNTTFLEPCNGQFWVGSIYTDMNQDRHRFGLFSSSAIEYLKHHSGSRIPDIVHAHDWQSAPCCWLDRGGAASAFTIHNLNYGADLIGGAMGACDVATTVSPTYAQEVSGHPAIAPYHEKFYGIRNGIDPDIWNPADDKFLPRGYTVDDMVQGKAAAKAQLRERMGLVSADVPVVGCVTRLTHQKGIHLIKHAAWRTLERGGQFVLLGSAPEPKVQAEFDALAADLGRQYPDRARLWFAYDEPLSHLIYAGSDMLLVPSMFEPCGLTQMIAMRYGTVPVVRRTGGLADTVMDPDHDVDKAEGLGLTVNGFSFDGMDAPGMDYALNRALSLYFSERGQWVELAKNGMVTDWSWSGPALDYLELYHKITRK